MAYFAVQTRKQELIEKRINEIERLNFREKLTHSEKELSGIIYERGVDNAGFARVRSRGDQAISNEHVKNNQNTRSLLKKSGIVPENLPSEEDIKKVNRRLKSESKKFLNSKNNSDKV
jgi:DNA-damage-inducible protein D